ncbi:MAG: hypothetical protein JWN86_3373 [Planctomycetota bacterium]|nr:hypothetical protein [Planctomycetota bacterium]
MLSVLVAAAVALPVFAALNSVLRRERSTPPNDPAAMVYRPAVLPVGAFLGAVLQDFPKALTEWAAWGYLACLVVLLAGAVLSQRRQRRAWSWWAAVPAGFVIALAALLGGRAWPRSLPLTRCGRGPREAVESNLAPQRTPARPSLRVGRDGEPGVPGGMLILDGQA